MNTLRQEGDSIRNSPQFQAEMARITEQDAKRTPLSFAFVNTPLPNGVIAIVRVNQPGPTRAYSVVNQSSFETRTYIHSLAAQTWYDNQRGDDDSPATITVYADGRVEAVSGDLGRLSGQIQVIGSRADSSGVGGRVLKKLKNATAADIPGFGTARVINPK